MSDAVVGMHLGGGEVNYGVDLVVMRAILKSKHRTKESSESWLTGILTKRKARSQKQRNIVLVKHEEITHALEIDSFYNVLDNNSELAEAVDFSDLAESEIQFREAEAYPVFQDYPNGERPGVKDDRAASLELEQSIKILEELRQLPAVFSDMKV